MCEIKPETNFHFLLIKNKSQTEYFNRSRSVSLGFRIVATTVLQKSKMSSKVVNESSTFFMDFCPNCSNILHLEEFMGEIRHKCQVCPYFSTIKNAALLSRSFYKLKVTKLLILCRYHWMIKHYTKSNLRRKRYENSPILIQLNELSLSTFFLVYCGTRFLILQF